MEETPDFYESVEPASVESAQKIQSFLETIEAGIGDDEKQNLEQYQKILELEVALRGGGNRFGLGETSLFSEESLRNLRHVFSPKILAIKERIQAFFQGDENLEHDIKKFKDTMKFSYLSERLKDAQSFAGARKICEEVLGEWNRSLENLDQGIKNYIRAVFQKESHHEDEKFLGAIQGCFRDLSKIKEQEEKAKNLKSKIEKLTELSQSLEPVSLVTKDLLEKVQNNPESIDRESARILIHFFREKKNLEKAFQSDVSALKDLDFFRQRQEAWEFFKNQDPLERARSFLKVFEVACREGFLDEEERRLILILAEIEKIRDGKSDEELSLSKQALIRCLWKEDGIQELEDCFKDLFPDSEKLFPFENLDPKQGLEFLQDLHACDPELALRSSEDFKDLDELMGALRRYKDFREKLLSGEKLEQEDLEDLQNLKVSLQEYLGAFPDQEVEPLLESIEKDIFAFREEIQRLQELLENLAFLFMTF